MSSRQSVRASSLQIIPVIMRGGAGTRLWPSLCVADISLVLFLQMFGFKVVGNETLL
jgi:hypothetical protein